MGYYDEIYLKRLNRYGLDYQSRIKNQREKLFEKYLLKTIYRVDFILDGETIEGSLEKYKQDDTQTLQYLLTKLNIIIPPGTIIEITNDNGITNHWMVYWLEEIKASGYNRYIVLKMTHFLKWIDRAGNQQESWAYMYGQENNMLKDEIRSRSRMDTIYTENLKMSFFVLPVNEFMKKDDYLEIGEGNLKEAYRVTGYDIQSTPGVEYVTVDPVYERDKSPTPKPKPEDNLDDYYWLNGGAADEE